MPPASILISVFVHTRWRSKHLTLRSLQLRSTDRQTIHLVIRDYLESPARQAATSDAPVGASSQVDAERGQASGTLPSFQQPPPLVPEPPLGVRRRPHLQASTHAHTSHHPPTSASTPTLETPEHMAAFQLHHQSMASWLNQIHRDTQLQQREAMARVLAGQYQRGRAQTGPRVVGTPTGNSTGNDSEPENRQSSPAITHTVHYETSGPNGTGHMYQVEAVFRAPPGSFAGLSPADVENIIREADANREAVSMTTAMQRNASESVLPNRPFSQPGVTTPLFSPSVGTFPGSNARPAPNSTPQGVDNTASGSGTSPQVQNGLQVYILSSPEGPRALVLNPSASETYYTPRLSVPMTYLQPRTDVGLLGATSLTTLQARHRARPQDLRRRRGQAAAQAAAQAPGVGQPGHPNNPPAAGLPPLLMQAWPYLWLTLRLGLFIWFFTSPTSSWLRWLTVVCIAVFIFAFSTGILNGLVENAWGPVGRHLDGLLPALDQPRARQAVLAGGEQGVGAVNEDPARGPQRMAARLVTEHRARQGWLAGQMRRLERAGILFLASIAPGVAERHIANLEAEARAEDGRRRAAEEATANTTAATAGDGSARAEGVEGQTGTGQPANEDHGRGDEDELGPVMDEIVPL